jgi:hypothetical protein
MVQVRTNSTQNGFKCFDFFSVCFMLGSTLLLNVPTKGLSVEIMDERNILLTCANNFASSEKDGVTTFLIRLVGAVNGRASADAAGKQAADLVAKIKELQSVWAKTFMQRNANMRLYFWPAKIPYLKVVIFLACKAIPVALIKLGWNVPLKYNSAYSFPIPAKKISNLFVSLSVSTATPLNLNVKIGRPAYFHPLLIPM